MAEFGWALSDVALAKARIELNECAEKRKSAIESVRRLIRTRPNIDFLRTDDVFILRFLRARKFDITKAFNLYAQYFEYRQKNPVLFKNFNASESGVKQALLDGFPGVLPHVDHHGRRILVIFTANWDHWRYSLVSLYRALLLSLERLLEEEETQINGFVIIVDWTEFSFKQSSHLKPKILKLIIEGLQDPLQFIPTQQILSKTSVTKNMIKIKDCFPARFSGIHFINQPWYVEAALTVIKPFLKDKTKDKVFMHGNNMTTLHSHIQQEILPAELGGSGPPYNNEYWAKQLIGDENFSYSDRNIFWPRHNEYPRSNSSPLRTNHSETYPLKLSQDNQGHPSCTELDENFFLCD